MNDAFVKFERESVDFQNLLDSIRRENADLKHKVVEQAQWIDLLEERKASSSDMPVRFYPPGSPCERESIGFSLLAIEVDVHKPPAAYYLIEFNFMKSNSDRKAAE